MPSIQKTKVRAECLLTGWEYVRISKCTYFPQRQKKIAWILSWMLKPRVAGTKGKGNEVCGLKQYLASSTWCYCLNLIRICCVLLDSHQSQLQLHRQPQSSLIPRESLLNILPTVTHKVSLFKIFLLSVELFFQTPLSGLCEWVNSSTRYLSQAVCWEPFVKLFS